MIIIPEGKKLILASKSPRRQQLVKELGLPFEVRTMEVKEDYPPELKGFEIAEFLAEKKSNVFLKDLAPDEIVLTSDTVVWCNGESLEKAKNAEEALEMLTKISGKSHEVITGVCLQSTEKKIVFHDTVKVHFKEMSKEMMEYYIQNYQPFDKAGAYGIQEWLGMVAIEAIEGSYFTVMGLPTHRIMEKIPLF